MSEIDEIVKHMKKAGFPVEVIARTRFVSKGWEARSQLFFYDKEENKPRYVDLLAHRAIDEDFDRFESLNFTVIAECKKSDKAWVFYTPPSAFLTTESAIATAAYLRVFSKPPLRPRQIRLLTQNHYVSNEPLDRLAVASYIAHTEDGQDSKDQIYTATNQVLKALQYQMEWTKKSFAQLNPPNILVIYYPAIIFDGHMYEYVLDEKEEPKLTETKYVKYEVGFQLQSQKGIYEGFLIDVVTKDFLSDYIDMLDREMEKVLKS